MSLSDKLQSRLDAHRAVRHLEVARAKKQRKADRLFLAGIALGLTVAGFSIGIGVKHPTSTLPPAPVSPETLVAEGAPIDYVCTLPDGARFHMTPTDCRLTKTPGTVEWKQRQSELAGIREQNEAHAAYEEASRTEVNSREAEKRADCRAGKIDRDTCDMLVWNWKNRV